jgi:CRP-like cAMP-binding protein
MENFRLFFQFLNKFIFLTEEEFDKYIRPYLQTRHFKKKQVITVAGEVEEFFNFVSRGLARKYFNKAEEEINVQIATEGQMINAFESFYTRVPTEYCIESLESTTLISISHDDLEKIYATNAKMERTGRMLISFAMIIKDRWQLNMMKLSPRERFLSFVKKKPELIQRVPQKYLASFLNIQPETFSRFKHLLRERISD